MEFVNIVLQFNHSQAKDPRDKLYGLLGLAKDADKLVPSPDYRCHFADVYIDFTMAVIKSTGKLNLCCISASAAKRAADLPGWVFDPSADIGRGMLREILTSNDAERRTTEMSARWKLASQGNLLPQGHVRRGTFVYGNGEFKSQHPEITYGPNGPCLHALGVIIDSVGGLGGIIDPFRETTSPIVQSEYTKNAYGSPKALIEAIWYSMVLKPDKFSSEAPLTHIDHILAFYNASPEQHIDPTFREELLLWPEATRDLRISGKALGQWCRSG